MKLLVLYDQYSTHTNTVYEHLVALRSFSVHEHFYCHSGVSGDGIEWDGFDVVVIHYSARLISHSISSGVRRHLSSFQGAKVLFVQDEYDLTERLREMIDVLAIDLVFTCVPEKSVDSVYPPERFPATRFVSTLTGYVPANPQKPDQWTDIEKRPNLVGYRGRALPFWYGDLGQEKQEIAERFRREGELRGLRCDIEWDDRHRIYGDAWPRFMASCRATLGTESGSNLFDDDGSVRRRFEQWRAINPDGGYLAARAAVLGNLVEKPLMNQVSPRIFEAIASGTALVLFEGNYSGVIQANVHYISLCKDFSNIEDVFTVLMDIPALREMTHRAYRDVIESGAWSYANFVADYDQELAQLQYQKTLAEREPRLKGGVTVEPLRLQNVNLPPGLAAMWHSLPISLRTRIYPTARALALSCRRLIEN
nr:hypothetical protein [uncultured Rhodoferax sp.]